MVFNSYIQSIHCEIRKKKNIFIKNVAHILSTTLIQNYFLRTASKMLLLKIPTFHRSPTTCRSQYSRRSSVHFKMSDKDIKASKEDKISLGSSPKAGMQATVKSDNSMCRSAVAHRSSVKPDSNILEEVDFSAIGKEEHRKSILAAKNSLELHR